MASPQVPTQQKLPDSMDPKSFEQLLAQGRPQEKAEATSLSLASADAGIEALVEGDPCGCVQKKWLQVGLIQSWPSGGAPVIDQSPKTINLENVKGLSVAQFQGYFYVWLYLRDQIPYQNVVNLNPLLVVQPGDAATQATFWWAVALFATLNVV